MSGQINLRSTAPLFDVQYVAPAESLFDQYLAYPLVGVRGLRSCGYARWRSEFDETVATFKAGRPVHTACIDRVLVASSLYNLASTGIGDFLAISRPFPIFTRGVKLLHAELSTDAPSIALEGGICLFQPGELLLVPNARKPSAIDLFYEASRTPDVVEMLRDVGVQGVVCRRRIPSLQNYLHLYRLISFAVTLNAPVIVGLPDTEYIAEAYRIIGREAAEALGLLDIIVASSTQVRQIAVSIAQRLGATIVLNSSESDVSIQEAMQAACNEVLSALATVQGGSAMVRRDLVGFLAMPLVPKYLFSCRLILSVLPVAEARTIGTLARLFPSLTNACIAFPDLPFPVTAQNAHGEIVCAQLGQSIFESAQHDLSALTQLPAFE